MKLSLNDMTGVAAKNSGRSLPINGPHLIHLSRSVVRRCPSHARIYLL